MPNIPSPTLNQTTFSDLWQRVNAIDGQNLTAPAQSQITNLQNQLNGLQTQIEQVSLGFQADLIQLNAQLASIQQLLKSVVGGS